MDSGQNEATPILCPLASPPRHLSSALRIQLRPVGTAVSPRHREHRVSACSPSFRGGYKDKEPPRNDTLSDQLRRTFLLTGTSQVPPHWLCLGQPVPKRTQDPLGGTACPRCPVPCTLPSPRAASVLCSCRRSRGIRDCHSAVFQPFRVGFLLALSTSCIVHHGSGPFLPFRPHIMSYSFSFLRYLAESWAHPRNSARETSSILPELLI